MFCRFCGAVTEINDNFCINCGKKIERPINQVNRPIYHFDQRQFDQNKSKLDASSQSATKLSLILAIIALVLAVFQSHIGIILGIVSFVFANKEQQKPAIIISAIAIVISLMNIFGNFYFLHILRRIFMIFKSC